MENHIEKVNQYYRDVWNSNGSANRIKDAELENLRKRLNGYLKIIFYEE